MAIEHIFEVTKKEGIFRKAAPMTTYQARDKRRYCAYHESSGHSTHECHQLKDEIESLIREGKLTDWVVREVKKLKGGMTKKPDVTKGEEDKEASIDRNEREGSIHTIFGGPHPGGTSKNSMETKMT